MKWELADLQANSTDTKSCETTVKAAALGLLMTTLLILLKLRVPSQSLPCFWPVPHL